MLSVLNGQERTLAHTRALFKGAGWEVVNVTQSKVIGQPLSLLLKLDPLVSSLSLYDIRLAPGVAADVSHVDTPGEVSFSMDFNITIS